MPAQKSSSVQNLIRFLHDGKANGRHAAELEQVLSANTGHTQEPTRDLIREAIVSAQISVGSTTTDGYFLVDSQDELDSVIGELEARISGIQARIKGLREGWKRRAASRNTGGNWPK